MSKKAIDKAEGASLVTEQALLTIKDLPDWGERFATRWRALLPDKAPPDLRALLEFLALDLRGTRVPMVDAAQTHELEIAADGELRGAVHDAAEVLKARYLDARDLYKSVYGREGANRMGFAFTTETTPKRLRRRVSTVLGRFRKLPRKVIPVPPGKEGLGLRPSQIVNLLEAAHKALGKAIRRLAAAERKAWRSRGVKTESHDQHVGRFSSHTLCGEAICRLVGLGEEVSRFKAAKRRRQRFS